MNDTCQKLSDALKDLDQFNPDSLLVKSIMNVRKCNVEYALQLASKHCNMISTYGILFALGYISMSYEEFYSYCLRTGICTENGYLNLTKTQIFKSLAISAQIVQLPSLPSDRKAGDLYQVPINNKHHWTACGVDDDLSVHLYDTHAGYRGEYGGEMTAAFKVHEDKPDYYNHIF
jgi:hypothetical protein